MKEIKEIIRSQLLSTNKKAMGIIGPAGVGKSDIIKELAKELNRPIIELRAGYKTPGDLIGVPYAEEAIVIDGLIYKTDEETKIVMNMLNLSTINAIYFKKILSEEEKQHFLDNKLRIENLMVKYSLNIKYAIMYDKEPLDTNILKVGKEKFIAEEVEKITAFLKPEWLLQLQNTPNGIFLLEEISNASPEVQGALYEVLLDWAINNVKIPKTVNILFTGNRSEDAIGIASDLQSTFYTRGTLLTVEESDVKFESWKEWALLNKIHPAILSYLESTPSALLHKKQENQSYCTPRTWAILSQNLYDNEYLFNKKSEDGKKDKELWNKIVKRLILTNIPEETNFASYYIEGMKIKKAIEYINNPDLYQRDDELFMHITYNIAYYVSEIVEEKDVNEKLANFFKVLSTREGMREGPILVSLLNTIKKEWYSPLQLLNTEIGCEIGDYVMKITTKAKNTKEGKF